MKTNDTQQLYASVSNLLDLKLDIMKEMDNLNQEIQRLSRTTDSDIQWSYLLEDLKREVDDVNIEYIFGFIDDFEEEINDIQYKEDRAQKKKRIAINPLLKNTPVYFDDAFPASITDYMKKKKEEK